MLRELIHNQSMRIGLAVFLGTLAFTQWGYFWYAMLLDDVWQALIDHTEEELIHLAEQRGWLQSFNTYFISLVQACGLMILLALSRARSFFDYQVIGLVCSLLIATPVLGNAVLFAGQPSALWVLDFVHFILGYAGLALTFWICIEGLPSFFEYLRGRFQVSQRLNQFLAAEQATKTNIPWITQQRRKLL